MVVLLKVVSGSSVVEVAGEAVVLMLDLEAVPCSAA